MDDLAELYNDNALRSLAQGMIPENITEEALTLVDYIRNNDLNGVKERIEAGDDIHRFVDGGSVIDVAVSNFFSPKTKVFLILLTIC